MHRLLGSFGRKRRSNPLLAASLLLGAIVVVAGALAPTSAFADFQIEVVTPAPGGGYAPVTEFRWLVEEDPTFDIVPGEACVDANLAECLSTGFHRSYAPVIAKGHSSESTTAVVSADKRYFVSVLPDAGYAMGGTQVAAGETVARVIVQAEPIPTAQIRVFVFRDNFPINNAPDTPEELGLEGFKIVVEEAGGRYGMSAGIEMQDAFGNMLGTAYAGGDPNSPIMPSGMILTDAEGIATVKNLSPGKYGIMVVPPPTGACPPGWSGTGEWQQTATIEGKKVIDAWVKANEPAYFAEFGPPGPHVFIGFTQDCQEDAAFTGGATISGQVRSLHLSRPPATAFHDGAPFPSCWIGLNDMSVGLGRMIYSRPCQDATPDGTEVDSGFFIENVPPGDYQLVVFDANLDMIISSNNITVAQDGTGTGYYCPTPTDPTRSCDLGNVSVFSWFAKTEHYVFNDKNENGFWEPAGPDGIMGSGPSDPARADDELPLAEQAINLRWRDGSMYQSAPTDMMGYVPFEEVFPFFAWLVAEVDFARFKATGATVIVDAGGEIPPDDGWNMPSRDILNPQAQYCTAADVTAGTPEQIDAGPDGKLYTADDVVTACAAVGNPIINPNTGNNLSRTEPGVVLTEAFQAFLGQTNVFEWGKKAYGRGENGGISGIVFYDVTRAENDPAYAGAEPWQPGIPRIQVGLYRDGNADGVIDDLDGDGCPTPADVDNHPFGNFPGLEDFDYPALDSAAGCSAIGGSENGVFDYGDAIQLTTTDSWDDSLPEGCQGDVYYVCPSSHPAGEPCTAASPGAVATDCYDGLRNFNQVRPGVFDGGYAFDSYYEGGVAQHLDAEGHPIEAELTAGLPSGTYIVESGAHRIYEAVKEEDRNVDFGDEYVPSQLLLPPPCVNWDDVDSDGFPGHRVPDVLTLFPGQAVEAGFAGQDRPLCDRKQVALRSGANAAADFFMFTEVPVAGHIRGFILNDLANEFDPNAPNFGEKYSPPFLPVSIQDWTGQEIGRVYSDRWGSFDAMVPSTFSANLPFPSGMAPNMLTTCMNHPGPIANPAYDPDPNSPTFDPRATIIDPQFDRKYSQFCYTFQYMPGTTTYLDTPVLPIAAFAGPGQDLLDCEFQDGTPVIWTVSGRGNGLGGGPYTRLTGNGRAYRGFEIISAGQVEVPNPDYNVDGPDTRKTITRDFGFGDVEGEVWLGGMQLEIQNWSNGVVTTRNTIPLTAGGSHQLTVIRGDNGRETPLGLTATVGGFTERVDAYNLNPGASLQAAIDLAQPGDLIMVPPGTYNELAVMWKPVRLQGWGAFAVTINAAKTPAEKLAAWRTKVQSLLNEGAWTPLPGQECVPGDPAAGLEPACLFTEEGPGIIVLSLDRSATEPDGQGRVGFGLDGLGRRNSRIDGIGVTGGDTGGAIFVNGYARWLEISNNRIVGNAGHYGGGIRIGHPFLTVDNSTYDDSHNVNISVHNNQVIENGGLGGFGGGISVNHGSDSYRIVGNWVCGNFTQGDGGGIGHYGFSTNSLIAANTVLFNQSFSQGTSQSGGGIFVGGGAPLAPLAPRFCVINDTTACTQDADCVAITPGDSCAPQLFEASNLSPGTGNVVVLSNLVQGNLAGAGDGGGIRLSRVSGQDVLANAGPWFCTEDPGLACAADSDCADAGGTGLCDLATAFCDGVGTQCTVDRDCTGACAGSYEGWNKARLFNNMIVNNVAGLAGGGLSLQDAAYVDLVNNTIANNDSTGTAGAAFAPGSPNESTVQPSGVVSRQHSTELLGVLPITGDPRFSEFSNPWMVNDIVLHNRSFKFIVCGSLGSPAECAGAADPNFFGLWPQISGTADQVYWDLGVMGTATQQYMDPRFSILSNTTLGVPTDTSVYQPDNRYFDEAADVFALRYWNGDRGQTIPMVEPASTLSVQPAFDEGGNFIDVRFGPLRPSGDYHLTSASAAIDGGSAIPADCGTAIGALAFLCEDFDGDSRNMAIYDIGADESFAGAALLATAPAAVTFGVASGGGSLSGGSAAALPTAADTPTGPVTNTPAGAGAAAGADVAVAADTGTAGAVAPLAVDDPLPLGQGPVLCSDLYPGTTAGGMFGPDPWGNTFPAGSKCMHLAAGDGFVNMADTSSPLASGGRGRRLYIFSFRDVTGLGHMTSPTLMEEGFLGAEFPAPTISLDEGDEFYLHLSNVGMQIRPDLFDPHTVHYHGFPEASSVFDGVPDASISINMGGTLTYYYNIVEPGTYMYHCHVEATEHMQMGMLGNLYVRPAQNRTGCAGGACPVARLGGNADPAAPLGYVYNDGDGSTAYDVEFPIQIGSFDPDFHQASEDVQPLPFALMTDEYPLLNGRGYPETVRKAGLVNTADAPRTSQRVHSAIEATQGQRILLRISNLNVTNFYTLRSLGIPMEIVGVDAKLQRGPGGDDLYYRTDSVTLGGGEARDVILHTADVEPGTYFLYTTNLNFLANDQEELGGMMTEIVIHPVVP